MKKVSLDEFAVMTSQKDLLTLNTMKGKYIDLKEAPFFNFTKQCKLHVLDAQTIAHM